MTLALPAIAAWDYTMELIRTKNLLGWNLRIVETIKDMNTCKGSKHDSKLQALNDGPHIW